MSRRSIASSTSPTASSKVSVQAMGCEERRRPERLDPPEQRPRRAGGLDSETNNVLSCLRLVRPRRQRAAERLERHATVSSVSLSVECLGKAEANADMGRCEPGQSPFALREICRAAIELE